jgi:hypothetical protein
MAVMLVSNNVQWWASCAVLLFGAVLTQAQELIPAPRGASPEPAASPDQSTARDPAQAQGSCLPASASMPCASAPQPKVILHVQQPEVIYDNAPAASTHFLGRCFKKHQPAQTAAAVSTTSVLTPMSFSSGVVGQGLSLQALSPQVSALNLQSFGGQGIDLSDLRTAQELELHTTQLAALQAARDAQNKAYSASMQRIRTHLTSITPQAVKQDVQSTEIESCCKDLKNAISELKTSVDNLRSKVEDLQKTCEAIKNNPKLK